MSRMRRTAKAGAMEYSLEIGSMNSSDWTLAPNRIILVTERFKRKACTDY